jgi:hypothetical protein
MSRLVILALLAMGALRARAQVQRLQLSKSVVLLLDRRAFAAAQNHVEYARKVPVAINGKPIFGTDGELPKYRLASATLLMNGLRYSLQVDGMYNPWFGTGANAGRIRLLQEGPAFKLQAILSDGAGSYGAEWLLIGSSSIRTILTKEDELLTGYFQNKPIK